jgi:tetratricopeptide (TPR) repeat protein
MCLLFVKLDERDAFRRWAGTARSAAIEAEDPATLSWVLAQEAYGHFYSGDLDSALKTAQQAQSLTRRTPLVGAALAAALEARALAACGRVRETRAALGRAETVLSGLEPASVTASAFGYTESQLRFHEGNAYTRLRDTRRALPAQERALELCPPGDYTDWALTRLDRASCLSQDGDAAAAVDYASETVTRLRTAQCQGIISLRARELVRALPAGYRAEPAVREFETLLPAVESVKEIPGP